jgi:hypothetical protein
MELARYDFNEVKQRRVPWSDVAEVADRIA